MSKKIEESIVFNGKLFSVITERWASGKKDIYREIVRHPGAVAVIPVKDNKYIYLVSQFREAVEENILEIPAGLIEPGENIKQCALRELREEIGAEVKQIDLLFEYYSSPGFTDEKMFMFLASIDKRFKNQPDNDENLEIIKMDLREFINMFLKGEIQDSKTAIAALYLKSILKDF